MQSELKPCAHCGGEAYIDDDTMGHSVVCCKNIECRAQGPFRPTDDEKKALREALVATEDAIAEYYRYWTGGEMRGSYDGKPERNGLWQALHKARQALAGAKP